MTTVQSEPTETESGRFRRVVIPLANPESAPLLIKIGKALTDPDDGQLMLVTVITGEAEAESSAEAIDELREAIEAAKDDRFDLEMDARTAPAIARGILDYSREQNADLVVLGVDPGGNGGFSAINEAVMEATHCGVIAVRPGSDADAIDRVVVGVDGSDQSRTAAKIAMWFGEALGLPLQAVHVRDRTYSRAFANSMLDRSIADLPASRRVKRAVVEAAVVGHGIAARSDGSDLVVLGSSKQTRFGTSVSTNTAELVMRRSRATVVVVSPQADDDRSLATRALGRIRALRPTLTRLERDTVVWSSAAAAPLTTDFIILLAVSALLASFGLLQNSAAVVIGAMLVAPLLGPLASASTGLVTARLGLTARALVTLGAGTLATFGVAAAAGIIIPVAAPTTEMIARGSPSLVDLGVAAAAGVVGAYATARKDIPAALAGVAIAAALVPPLCTTGLAVAFGDFDLAYGSFLLFATNMVTVIVTGAVILRWMGMRPSTDGLVGKAVWGTAVVVAAAALLMVIVGLQSFQGTRQAQLAADDLSDLFPAGDVIDVASRSSAPLIVTATVRTSDEVTAGDVAAIEARLEERLGTDIRLEVVVERVVVSGD